jgi:peptidoglycan/LPS O-acetylase OafA/YrhL
LLALAAYGAWWSLFSDQGFGYNNTYFVSGIYAFLILQLSRYELSSESGFGKFAAFLGRYSYGIYAYHQVMIDLTKNIVKEPGYWKVGGVWSKYFIEKCSLVTFLAILATYLTNKLFEGPIQRWGYKKLEN